MIGNFHLQELSWMQSKTTADERLRQKKESHQAVIKARPKKNNFGPVRLISKHSGVALTNVNFKNLTENFGFPGRQDHYDAYVQDVGVAWSQVEVKEMAKCLWVDKSTTKTRTGGLTAEHRNKTSRGLPDVSHPRTGRTQILCKRCLIKHNLLLNALDVSDEHLESSWGKILFSNCWHG